MRSFVTNLKFGQEKTVVNVHGKFKYDFPVNSFFFLLSLNKKLSKWTFILLLQNNMYKLPSYLLTTYNGHSSLYLCVDFYGKYN